MLEKSAVKKGRVNEEVANMSVLLVRDYATVQISDLGSARDFVLDNYELVCDLCDELDAEKDAYFLMPLDENRKEEGWFAFYTDEGKRRAMEIIGEYDGIWEQKEITLYLLPEALQYFMALMLNVGLPPDVLSTSLARLGGVPVVLHLREDRGVKWFQVTDISTYRREVHMLGWLVALIESLGRW